MQNNDLNYVRVFFALLFLATLAAGAFLLQNYERLFGADPHMPSENSSSRAYSKLAAFVIWAHAVLLTGVFALLLY